MKKTITLIFLSTLNFFIYDSNAQIYSEAPITIVDGKRYTDMIYVKFRSHDILPTVTGEVLANGLAISPDFPLIREIFKTFGNERNMKLKDIRLRKAIPRSTFTNRTYIDPESGMQKNVPDLSTIYLVEFPHPVDIDNLIALLKEQPEVDFSHGPVQTINLSDHTPNDKYYVNGIQWYLDAIDAPGAWAITKGSASVKIGIIESRGVAQQNHPDLEGNIAVGGGTTPVDQHATWVAGLAGAVTDNNEEEEGIASLGWNSKILTYTYDFHPFRRNLANKISEAVLDGAKVLNLSFHTIYSPVDAACVELPGDYFDNESYGAVDDAIEAAIANKVTVVAAAGNHADPGADMPWPCYDIPFEIWPASYPGS